MMTTRIKSLAKRLGFDTHKILFGIFQRNAAAVLARKYSTCDTDTKELIASENERYHYGDTEITEAASEAVLASFTLDRIQFIKEFLSPAQDYLLADLGDSNGIFLRSCGQSGISVNISDAAVRSLHEKGMETIKANIESIPFKDNSISTVFLFETLEHVPNPVSLLNEIGRICSDSLILSIPYVEVTRIHPYNYDPSWPIYQHHIFEFNKADFSSIMSYTPFTLEAERIAVVLDERVSIAERFIFFLWNLFVEKDTFCGCFKKFYIYKLKKITGPNP
jgi:SAM-dependent methyltransferase